MNIRSSTQRKGRKESGFTLIELSIVLVIIGLIVGGILVGQDLIKAAEVRAQISQIEKFNSATNTFRGKFNAIPGDMSLSTALQFGFTQDGGVSTGTTCGGTGTGKRDGNGLLDNGSGTATNLGQGTGEVELYWMDLSSAPAGNLIEGAFPNSGGASLGCGTTMPVMTTTSGALFVGNFLPAGKIGHGAYVITFETSGFNWFGLETITATLGTGSVTATPSIPVMQAYNMDKKMDDGVPNAGSVQAGYVSALALTNTGGTFGPATDATTSCFNTGNNVYSIGSVALYGGGGNCALMFRFQ